MDTPVTRRPVSSAHGARQPAVQHLQQMFTNGSGEPPARAVPGSAPIPAGLRGAAEEALQTYPLSVEIHDRHVVLPGSDDERGVRLTAE